MVIVWIHRGAAIREGFDRLTELVPGLEGQGRSESIVLQKTVDFESKRNEMPREIESRWAERVVHAATFALDLCDKIGDRSGFAGMCRGPSGFPRIWATWLYTHTTNLFFSKRNEMPREIESRWAERVVHAATFALDLCDKIVASLGISLRFDSASCRPCSPPLVDAGDRSGFAGMCRGVLAASRE
jgi:hypothetical protein